MPRFTLPFTSRFTSRFTLPVLSTAFFTSALCITPAESLHAQANTTSASAAAPLVVTVLDAGTAPRRALRYTLVAGVSESVTMRQKISMNIEMGGMALPSQALPATLITTQVAVSAVAADGSASVTQEIVHVDLESDGADAMMLDAMRPQVTAMKGTTMNYTFSPTGHISKLAFGEGAPAAVQAIQSLASSDQLSVAFPTQEVGVGARWKAARPVTQNGLTIMQDVEYEVKSLGADSMVLEMSITQSAKDQVMDAAAMPPGASAKLRSLDGKGVSTMAIRFDRVQPSVDMKMNITMAIDLDMGGQSNAMNQTMVMEMKTVPASKP